MCWAVQWMPRGSFIDFMSVNIKAWWDCDALDILDFVATTQTQCNYNPRVVVIVVVMGTIIINIIRSSTQKTIHTHTVNWYDMFCFWSTATTRYAVRLIQYLSWLPVVPWVVPVCRSSVQRLLPRNKTPDRKPNQFSSPTEWELWMNDVKLWTDLVAVRSAVITPGPVVLWCWCKWMKYASTTVKLQLKCAHQGCFRCGRGGDGVAVK